MDTWIAVFAPKRVPADVVATLNAALTKALQDPDTQKQLRASGFDPTPMDAASVARVIEEETPRFAEIAKRAGIKAQ
ncbi:Tripartite tricarboxylate transporter family receptor [compost metagenome]